MQTPPTAPFLYINDLPFITGLTLSKKLFDGTREGRAQCCTAAVASAVGLAPPADPPVRPLVLGD